MNVLFVENGKDQGNEIKFTLEKEHYLIDTAPNKVTALEKMRQKDFDCVLIDLNGERLENGSELFQLLNRDNSSTGMIVITDNPTPERKAIILSNGADDVMAKETDSIELHARIRAVCRRLNKSVFEISFNEITLNINRSEVYVKGNFVKLTKMEYQILKFFLENRNQVVSKEEMIKQLWGEANDDETCYHSLYTHIKNLRKKLIDKGCRDYIQTIYGYGYNFNDMMMVGYHK